MPYFYMMSNPYYLIGTILVSIGALFMMYAQSRVSTNYAKYSKVQNQRNITGFEVAREMLDQNGLYDITIHEVKGKMSDHYNPKTKSVHLSTQVYHDTSIASLAIAAHEVGHAIQHSKSYQPLIFRNAILPFCNAGQSIGWIVIMVGLLFSNMSLAWIGILLMSGILLFQIVTLPVEFDASSRALDVLKTNYLTTNEVSGAKSMLSAAALTYVAAMLATLLSLLRIVLLVVGNNRDEL